MSLTPCRFFAQGNCRFGNSCRFYHGQPTGGGGATTTTFFGNRTLAPSNFQPQQQLQHGALNLTASVAKVNQNLDIIVDTVKKDMQEWQSSGIWPYSCYGPIGGKPCVPGFEDFSQEEYRYNYMLHGGNIPPQIPQLHQQMNLLRINYQQHSQENRITLERIATSATATSPTLQSQQQAASIFGGGGGGGGGGGTQSSIFGGGGSGATQQTTAGSIFGGGGSMFGSQPQTAPSGGGIFGATGTASIFGGNQAQQPQQQQSQFGAPLSTVTPQQSIFGSTPGATGATNLFQQQPPQQQSIFGQPQRQVAPAPSLFQQPPAPAGGGIFQTTAAAGNPPGGLFQMPQQQQQQQSIFGGGGGGGGSIFGGNNQTQQPQSQFGAPPSTVAPQQSIFGGPTGNSPLMQGGGGQTTATPASILAMASQQKGVYTDESELTPEELEAFKSDQFTMESIPTRPPPQNLCL